MHTPLILIKPTCSALQNMFFFYLSKEMALQSLNHELINPFLTSHYSGRAALRQTDAFEIRKILSGVI